VTTPLDDTCSRTLFHDPAGYGIEPFFEVGPS
jgi:hypothetical protein